MKSNQIKSLRKRVRIRIILVRIFPAFSHIRTEYAEIRSISPYSIQMRENAGKMLTRITLNTDTFQAVNIFLFLFTTGWLALNLELLDPQEMPLKETGYLLEG